MRRLAKMPSCDLKKLLFKIGSLMILIAIGTAGFCAPAWAKVEEKFSRKTYLVKSQSVTTLYQDAAAASPIRINGAIFLGQVHWSIGWRFTTSRRLLGECSLQNPVVELSLVLTMPSLVSHSSEVRAAFEKLEKILFIHEGIHMQIAKESAYEALYRLLRHPPHKNCDLLIQMANAAAEKEVSKGQAKNARYDKITEHGKYQERWRE